MTRQRPACSLQDAAIELMVFIKRGWARNGLLYGSPDLILALHYQPATHADERPGQREEEEEEEEEEEGA